MASTKVIDKDLGYDKFMKQMAEMSSQPFVKIGVLGTDEKSEDGEVTVVEYATYNEFGTADIPERSFIRSTMDERKRRIFGKAFKLQGDIVLGKMTIDKALAIMGTLIKGNIIQKITNLRSPANADSTVQAKGSSNPLIDSGRLKQSIDYEVES